MAHKCICILKSPGRSRTSKPRIHYISIPQADAYALEWRVFKKHFDALLKAKTSQSILANRKLLDKYMLINYEKFELQFDPLFEKQLVTLAEEAAYIQIHFGMKKIDFSMKDIPKKYQMEFKGKEFMSCVVLVGMDVNDKPIDIVIKPKLGKLKV